MSTDTQTAKRPAKMFSRYSAAVKYAANPDGTTCPIIRVGLKNYIVGDFDGIVGIEYLQDGTMMGCVTLRHLARLRNANWATSEAEAKSRIADLKGWIANRTTKDSDGRQKLVLLEEDLKDLLERIDLIRK